MVRARDLGTVLLVGATLAGCPEKAPQAEKIPKVEVIRPERKDLARKLDVPGDVHGYFESTLLAEVAGYVKTVCFDKGDLVHKGDVIAEIDVPEIEADRLLHEAKLEESRAALHRAEAAVLAARAGEEEAQAGVEHATAIAELQVSIHERSKALRAAGDISIQDLEVAAGQRGAAEAEKKLALARVHAAKAEVARAEANEAVARATVGAEEAALEGIRVLLGYATIRAPFDGIVTARFVDPGALLQRATRSEAAHPIVSVSTRGRVRLDFQVPESEIAFCRPGTPIEVTSDAYRGRSFAGTVTRVASALSPETRTMLCEAELPNEDDELFPGMYAMVHVTLEVHENALVVPPEAVSEQEKKTRVYVVEDGVAHEREVSKGWDFGTYVEIASGLDGRESIVLSGGELKDGDRVSAHAASWSPEEATGKESGKKAAKKKGKS
jgi:RND family efflux transporter MFP subunit